MVRDQVKEIEDLFNLQTGWDVPQHPHQSRILQKYDGQSLADMKSYRYSFIFGAQTNFKASVQTDLSAKNIIWNGFCFKKTLHF